MAQEVTKPILPSPKEVEIMRLLALGEMYGLELVRASDGSLNRSGIYVELGRLKDKGFVLSRTVASPGPGPRRRLYELTARGRRALRVRDMLVACQKEWAEEEK